MTLAESIRSFVVSNYIRPVRRLRNGGTVIVHSRDVVRQLNLQDRVPAVCGALDAQKFLIDNSIKLLSRTGPKFGLTAVWEFSV